MGTTGLCLGTTGLCLGAAGLCMGMAMGMCAAVWAQPPMCATS